MSAEKFKAEYAKLNSKQKEAVDAIEGPVMVIAGPGTGKTTILTLRIANILLQTDTPASGILALTFTEAGVKAMKSKLREIIGETALEVPIHTFHGFAASVIAEFQDHFPHLWKSAQITGIETEVILRKILSQKKFAKLRPLGDPDFYIQKIIAAVSDAKQEAWTPEMIKSFAQAEIEKIKSDPQSLSSRGQSKGRLKGESLRRIEKCERTLVFAEVYAAYEENKKAERKIDFDDLIFELLQALRRDKLLLQSLQEKFLYILLDEHQDTNDAQNLIVRHLADFFETPNLFVVGDEKQAIYRFQGASVENFLSFQKIWSGMRVISLTDNYRSHQHILDASFKMIEKNYGEKEYENLRVKLVSGAKVKAEPLDLLIAPDPESEAASLTEKLKVILKNEPAASVAVIVRRNSEISKIFSLLQEADVPAAAERGANIFSHPVGSLYFSLLEFLANPGNSEALTETFIGGLWGLSFDQQVRFIKLAASGQLAEIEKAVPTLSQLQKKLSQSEALEFLYLAAELSGFSEIASRHPLSVEVWRGVLALALDLVRANNLESPKSLIAELLAYKKSAERRTVKIAAGQAQSQITIMTAHGSKGLEFDYVFLPYATEETWIRKNRGSSFVLPKEKEEADDIRDERRLFYVSLTRAKKHVSISYYLRDELGKEQTPLRFIDELDQKFIKTIELPKISKTAKVRTPEGLKIKQNLEETEYTKRVLLEKGLSVTALNHFLECPNKFFYKSILKMPEAPNASSEKGNAMHAALANVWKEITVINKGTGNTVSALGHKDKALETVLPVPLASELPKKITKTIIESVQEYFQHSFLPLSEKEAVLEELIANAPAVGEALLEHFSQKGAVSTESWVETPFEYQGTEIKLHGRLDALLEHEKSVLVFDYKTREAMSVNAIKGETQNSDGNYFRQLVFYKILLTENGKFKGKTVEPALVFVKPRPNGSSDRCPTIFLPIEKSDMEKVKSEISNLLESVWSGEFLDQTCDDQTCQYCGYRKLLGL